MLASWAKAQPLQQPSFRLKPDANQEIGVPGGVS
jgi:hypothetical protein